MQSDMSHRQNLKRRTIAIGKSQLMQLDSRKYVSGIPGAIHLGYQSILTTIRYTHLSDHTKDNAADRINALIGQISIGWGNVK